MMPDGSSDGNPWVRQRARCTPPSVTTTPTRWSCGSVGTWGTSWQANATPIRVVSGGQTGKQAVVVAAPGPEPTSSWVEGHTGHHRDVDHRRIDHAAGGLPDHLGARAAG
jgi:hypothetical protein